ncbi:hypothetical protein GLAREA_03375 [Glarea lozoyensis ATCC 20868]|uniref:Uncharacterized protein n=1 Tax=Glarea lozoyensis (strain ATCC 20868 / MF5171) TaxID=1116229 RepID=S3DVJ3_GLAL2|nr:uncharacterized protein GLAREA_03375 [Glarea lozoyensis ATCC 20868]EPE30408.1 hypothetical protein GLAREA_03375 [Glarea lozoyensis ATCC 20868]
MSTNNSNLAHHLTDLTLTPILSSSQSSNSIPPPTSSPNQTTAQALTQLTTTALTAYNLSQRLALGPPQRILISTTSGASILHSYLTQPPSVSTQIPSPLPASQSIVSSARLDLRPLSADTNVDGENGEQPWRNGVEDERRQVPMLIATVIAPRAGEAGEGRRMAARLERIGRVVQRDWYEAEREAQDE